MCNLDHKRFRTFSFGTFIFALTEMDFHKTNDNYIKNIQITCARTKFTTHIHPLFPYYVFHALNIHSPILWIFAQSSTKYYSTKNEKHFSFMYEMKFPQKSRYSALRCVSSRIWYVHDLSYCECFHCLHRLKVNRNYRWLFCI